MTLAHYRGVQKTEGEAHAAPAPHAPAERAHPGPMEYARIGIILAIVTAVEVAIFYADIAHWALVSILIELSAMKFGLVVLWFMHLRFDSRLFSTLFVGGLLLAGSLFAVVLATLGGSLT